MKQLKVNPVGGWANATKDDMQKSCANLIGAKHCLQPEAVYEAFNKANVYLPSVMSLFMDKSKMLLANSVLLGLILDNDSEELYKYIGNYENLN